MLLLPTRNFLFGPVKNFVDVFFSSFLKFIELALGKHLNSCLFDHLCQLAFIYILFFILVVSTHYGIEFSMFRLIC